MVQLTLIHGEKVAMLEVGLDIALQDFLALCKMELDELAAVPAEQFRIVCNGRNTFPTSQNLSAPIEILGFGDNDAIYIEVVPQQSQQPPTLAQAPRAQALAGASRQPSSRPSGSSSEGGANNPQAALVSSFLSSLVKGIKTPVQTKNDDRVQTRKMFDAISAEPMRLDTLRVQAPLLAAAYEADPTNYENFHQAFIAHRGEQERRLRLAQTDPSSEEGQRFIAEQIARENIEFNHQFAMEHTPEAFIAVHMLYIRMKINGHPVVAFVDSGAQTSILSESCANRCAIKRLVDERYSGTAVGVGGTGKILGRIHSCKVQVEDHVFPCHFSVMGDRNMDILFGLDILRRHQCQIDLKKHVLRFGDGTETPFINEAEYQREMEKVQNDAIATSEANTSQQK